MSPTSSSRAQTTTTTAAPSSGEAGQMTGSSSTNAGDVSGTLPRSQDAAGSSSQEHAGTIKETTQSEDEDNDGDANNGDIDDHSDHSLGHHSRSMVAAPANEEVMSQSPRSNSPAASERSGGSPPDDDHLPRHPAPQEFHGAGHWADEQLQDAAWQNMDWEQEEWPEEEEGQEEEEEEEEGEGEEEEEAED